jgi:CheY-like chemotaxis protein
MVWRVLIADDSPTMRRTLGTVFCELEGYDVCGFALDGLEAVEMAEALRPDAILLDFQMPAMTGLRAAAKILKSRASVPIILYSLDDISDLADKATAMGIRKVISKSEVFSSLVPSLREILSAPRGSGAPPVPTFDIFSGVPDRDAVWVCAVKGFGAAKQQMDALAAEKPGSYFIFFARTHEVLARIERHEADHVAPADPDIELAVLVLRKMGYVAGEACTLDAQPLVAVNGELRTHADIAKMIRQDLKKRA